MIVLGRPCLSVAYPYGESDERVLAAAARAGYTAGCATGGTLRGNALDWPRVGVDGHDGRVLFEGRRAGSAAGCGAHRSARRSTASAACCAAPARACGRGSLLLGVLAGRVDRLGSEVGGTTISVSKAVARGLRAAQLVRHLHWKMTVPPTP